MKITRNPDGTVTVSVTKVAEEYDPTYADGPSGGLVIVETITAAEFAKAIAAKPAKAKRAPRKVRKATPPAASASSTSATSFTSPATPHR